ncbi:hypothetical protein LTR12_010992 [Friedmanniomyces endolithicus]|nr:hypothetical protein LTR12_010992 [Friedmanniomyces endolithicus]
MDGRAQHAEHPRNPTDHTLASTHDKASAMAVQPAETSTLSYPHPPAGAEDHPVCETDFAVNVRKLTIDEAPAPGPSNAPKETSPTETMTAPADLLVDHLENSHISKPSAFDLALCVPSQLFAQITDPAQLAWLWVAEDSVRELVIEKSVVMPNMIAVPFSGAPALLTLSAKFPGVAAAAQFQKTAEELFYSKNTFVADEWQPLADFARALPEVNRKQLRRIRVKYGYSFQKQDSKADKDLALAVDMARHYGALEGVQECAIECQVEGKGEKVLEWTTDPVGFFANLETPTKAKVGGKARLSTPHVKRSAASVKENKKQGSKSQPRKVALPTSFGTLTKATRKRTSSSVGEDSDDEDGQPLAKRRNVGGLDRGQDPSDSAAPHAAHGAVEKHGDEVTEL